LLWQYEVPERGGIVSSPLVADDCVYFGAVQDLGLSTYGAVYCLDRETGQPRWKFDNNGTMQQSYSSPCLAEGLLYVGEGMHQNFVCNLYCLEAASGHKRWQFQSVGHIESSPRVARGKVYFGAGDDGLYSVEAFRGKELWHHRGPVHIDSTPALHEGRVYAGSGVSRAHKQTEILCLDGESGRVIWRTPTDLPVWGSPAVDGEEVFFGLGNGRIAVSAQPPERPAGALLCADAATGNELWRYPASDAVLHQPVVAAEHVYFASRNARCYCLDRKSRQALWVTELGSPVVARPALCEGGLYVISTAGLLCRLDAITGRVEWTFDLAAFSQLSPQIYSSPSVVRAGGPGGRRRIYAGTELRSPISSAAVLYCLQE
jgi:outer membrane protein assembly factor BamB